MLVRARARDAALPVAGWPLAWFGLQWGIVLSNVVAGVPVGVLGVLWVLTGRADVLVVGWARLLDGGHRVVGPVHGASKVSDVVLLALTE